MAVSSTTLTAYIKQYTEFKANGMIITLPYKLGGKNLPSAILSELQRLCGGSFSGSTQGRINGLASSNPDKCGIDCSHLVYYALNEAKSGAVRTYFESKLNQAGMLNYAYGISAANLSGYGGTSVYGTKITRAMDVTIGDTICMDNGKHIAVVYNIITNSAGVVSEIHYAHSNSSHGPHVAYVQVTNLGANLNEQIWNDISYTQSQAVAFFNHVFRLSCI